MSPRNDRQGKPSMDIAIVPLARIEVHNPHTPLGLEPGLVLVHVQLELEPEPEPEPAP